MSVLQKDGKLASRKSLLPEKASGVRQMDKERPRDLQVIADMIILSGRGYRQPEKVGETQERD